MPCPDANLLVAFGEGALDEAERGELEAHIDGCAECAELVAELAREAAARSTGAGGSGAGASSAGDDVVSAASADSRTVFDGAPLPSAAPEPELVRLGRYLLLERLGVGGMGQVFAAYDPELDRRVALKVLRPELRRGRSASIGRARLLREAQTAASLAHPNVITIYDVGSTDDRVFIAMELVEGLDLRAWQKTATPGWREVVEAYLQAGEGLAAAHAAGLLHRDFKPDNALRGDDGIVRVLDFGLAKAAGEPTEDAELSEPSVSGSRREPISLTATGAVMGTPAYMAPEQFLGAPLDSRGDQFSFCVALWEAVYGKRPFAGDGFEGMRKAALAGVVESPPADRRVPRWLERALRRGLSVDPDARHDSMSALLLQLRRGLGRRRRWSTVGSVTAGAVLLTAVAYQGGRAERESVPTKEACGGAKERVDELWPASRQQAIEAAFEATSASFGGTSWASVQQTVDAYLERWQAAYVDACEATRVRGVQSEELLDRRMRCLERRRVELDSLLGLLEEPDVTLVERAPRAVVALPGLEACADTEGLARQQPLPDDPEVRAAVQRAQARLDEATALALAGRYQDAAEHARAVAEEAERLGRAPLRARALLRSGDLQDRLGDPRGSETTLRDAIVQAEAVGDDDTAASAWASLVYIVGLELARPDEGRFMAELATAKAQHSGSSADIRRSVLGNRAMLEYGAGDFDAAQRNAEAAIELVREHWGDDALPLTSLLDLLGSVHRARGERDEAEAAFRRALAITEAHLGPSHPDAAASHGNLSAVLHAAGRYDEALEHGERALALFESVDPRTPFVAAALNNVANVYTARREHERALPIHERALALRIEIFGETNPDVAQSLDGVGATLVALGRAEEGLERHRKALAIRREVHGDEHPWLAYSHHGIGVALLALGRGDEAREPLEAALASSGEESDPTERGETELALAEALVGSEPERAREMWERAREDLGEGVLEEELRRVGALVGD